MIDRENAAELVRRVAELSPPADAAIVRRCVEFALEHQAKSRPAGPPIERSSVLAAIGGWANQIAARYGAPVWLVGSALEHEDLSHVRDIDVRVVMPDAAFEARFGVAVEAWAREQWSTWSIGSRRWGAEMGKLSRGWMAQFPRLGVGLDLQVHPVFVARAFMSKPRRRLDTLDLLGDELPRATVRVGNLVSLPRVETRQPCPWHDESVECDDCRGILEGSGGLE